MKHKRLIVMKFGGTSVGHADRFRQCAALVRDAARHDRIVVVVSAMSGITDLIFKTLEAARQGDTRATEAGLQQFTALHEALIHNLLDQDSDQKSDQERVPAALEFAGKVF